MKFTKGTVKRIARLAAEYTGDVVKMADPVYLGDGPCYVDGHNPGLRWDTCASKTAGREAAAYYAGAAGQWGTLKRMGPMPAELREAYDDLGGVWQRPAVRASFAKGVAAAGNAWTRITAADHARRNPGTAVVGERRRLTLFNRDELITWSGGREPADPGSDVMLIAQLDGSVLVVVLGQTVERTPNGYRRVPSAELGAEAADSPAPGELL